MIFLNLLSAIAPTIWVVVAGALGVGVGAYGPKLFTKLKNDSLTRTINPRNAKTLPRKRTPCRASSARRSSPSSASRRAGRKRASSR